MTGVFQQAGIPVLHCEAVNNKQKANMWAKQFSKSL